MGILDGFFSLGAETNKAKGDPQAETQQGAISEKVDELSLEMENSKLVELANKWEKKWRESDAKKELESKQERNEKYWKGEHYTLSQKTSGKRELVDNLIFEGLETFIPTAVRQPPEPFVTAQLLDLAKKVGDRLAELSDILRLKLKLKKAVRHWALYYVGVIKLGWSQETDDISIQNKRPQELIFDPDAITDECEYEGDYLGEYRKQEASVLIEKYPEKAEFIKRIVNNELGTKVRYIEWWTNDFLFWTLKEELLGKSKNPHWNYDSMSEPSQTVDEFGNAVNIPSELIPGRNHFSTRKIPYAFLSIFSVGKLPFDETNQIEQVIPLQDVINTRQRQISRNADRMNDGALVSGDAFTKEQATQASNAIAKGKSVWIPRGNPNNVYKRETGAALPQFIYQSLQDYRNELRNIFGTTGLSPQGIKGEETVRGKILVKGVDTDRAALVVDHVEQFVDYIFNWMVQLMYVYYDQPRNVSRKEGSAQISKEEFIVPLVVSVKSGSMIPKDRLTLRNEAMDLWSASALDPLTLFERLEDPNPQQSAQRLILWMANPVQYAQQLGIAVPQPVAPGAPGAQPAGEAQPSAETAILNQVPIQPIQ